MNQIIRYAAWTVLFFFSLHAFPDEWDLLARKGDVKALKAALKERGPGIKVDAALIGKFCDKPEMVQALLDFVYGEADAVASVAERPPSGDQATPANLTVGQMAGNNDDNAVQRLYKKLADLENSGDDPLIRKRRIEAQNILTGFVMDPSSRFSQKVSGLPPWVSEMIGRAEQGRKLGYPKISFNADRKVTFTASDQEKGVKAYMSIFMVRKLPDDKEVYQLSNELLSSVEAHPLTYNADEDDFQLAPFGKHYSSVVSFKNIFKDMEPLTLYPGQWAIRVKHTTGYNKLRSDKTFYFFVEAGKNYVLDVTWERKNGSKMLHFEPREEN